MSKSYMALGNKSGCGRINLQVLEMEDGRIVDTTITTICDSYQMQGTTIIIDNSVMECATGRELFKL